MAKGATPVGVGTKTIPGATELVTVGETLTSKVGIPPRAIQVLPATTTTKDGVMLRATLEAGALSGVMIWVISMPGVGTTPRATKHVARGESIVGSGNGFDTDARGFE